MSADPEASLFGPLILALHRQRWFCLVTILLVGLGSTGWIWVRQPAPTWQAEAVVVFAPAKRSLLAARLESRALARQAGFPPGQVRVMLPPPSQAEGVSRVVSTGPTAAAAQSALTRALDGVLWQVAQGLSQEEAERHRQQAALSRRIETELARLPAPPDGAVRLPETDRPIFWIVDGKRDRSPAQAIHEARLTALLTAGAPALPDPAMTVIDPPGPASLMGQDMLWPLEVAWLVSAAVGLVAGVIRDVVHHTLRAEGGDAHAA